MYRTVSYEREGMTWMGENLKTTRYHKGDSIPYIAKWSKWESSTDGAYCYYDNDSSYTEAYGNLYTVADSRGLCPTGWHVPTSLEWYELEMHIESFDTGSGQASYQLKEAGTQHWIERGDNATDYAGFSGRRSGMRAASVFGDFVDLKIQMLYWSSTEFIDDFGADGAFIAGLRASTQGHYSASFHDKNAGFSIRCIKNNKQHCFFVGKTEYKLIKGAIRSSDCLMVRE